jgi:hypothetical protein
MHRVMGARRRAIERTGLYFMHFIQITQFKAPTSSCEIANAEALLFGDWLRTGHFKLITSILHDFASLQYNVTSICSRKNGADIFCAQQFYQYRFIELLRYNRHVTSSVVSTL